MTAFIFEDPSQPASRRRHPHLIVACDRCRQKKLKCETISGQTRCRNCVHRKNACTFRDRQQYLADKEHEIMVHILKHDPRAIQREDRASYDENPLAIVANWSPVTPTELSVTRDLLSTPQFKTEPDDEFTVLPSSNISRIPCVELHLSMLPYFIDVFFQVYGRTFLFMSYEHTLDAFWRSTLPVRLANAMALLAIPHCAGVESFKCLDLQTAATSFAEKAKLHISVQWDYPSILMVQALVLMSWYEIGNDNVQIAYAYRRRAFEMGIILKLGDHQTAQNVSDEDERRRLGALWETVRTYDYLDTANEGSP